MLVGNFTRDVITLAPTNMEITNQLLIGAIVTWEIPDGIFSYQVPIILLLFSDYKIEQGSIEVKKVHESLYAYYLMGKLWADSVYYAATAAQPFQLVATSITLLLANLVIEGNFNQDLEIDLSYNNAILESLEQIKNKNKKVYFERNPE